MSKRKKVEQKPEEKIEEKPEPKVEIGYEEPSKQVFVETTQNAEPEKKGILNSLFGWLKK
jgi:hypothetical protein